MKRVRSVPEHEVIAEFLRNEFYEPEFDVDRKRFERVVLHADLENVTENRIRRALLFRRRGHMWRELPADTQWWQMEVEAADLENLHVFPRAHWRVIGKGDFRLSNVIGRLRSGSFSGKTAKFVGKIHSIAARMRQERLENATVMLIGVDERRDLTILEGNHRVTAALLGSSDALAGLRFFVGLSPRMEQCCWYRTNVTTLWKYLKNRLRNLRNREEGVLRELAPQLASASYTGALTTAEPMLERK